MSAPADAGAAARILERSPIPPAIIEVARRLQQAGHAAVVVGGAVRDALLGLAADDWDLATSATPDEVQGLFRRTIATGLEHGTVTVMVADPAHRGERIGVEVTTFRGEGDYVDGRRPSTVTFHRDLVEDLARRDFTVNAFAWDPIRRVFSDPFDGLSDLGARKIRAVGDPSLRFSEDGLRTMRAVRLCATRDFSLDPPTRAAIEPALPVLDQVSRERVHVELFKLLAAPRPSQGLVPMLETGMWPHVLCPLPEEAIRRAIEAVDRLAADPVLRLARLLRPGCDSAAGMASVLRAVDALRPSRAERRRLEVLVSGRVDVLAEPAEPPVLRRRVAQLGREHLDDALALLESPVQVRERLHEAVRGAPLSVGELAIKGRDLIAAGLVSPGPEVGRRLSGLLEQVLDDPLLNDRERLLALASSSP